MSAPTSEGPWPADLPESSRKLLSAATQAFATKGYHATSTRDIASQAGMSPAALYVHYASKAALLGHISVIGHTASVTLMEEAAVSQGSPRDRLRRAVSILAQWHAEFHTIARIVHNELGDVPPEQLVDILRDRRRIEAILRAQIEAGISQGQFSAHHDLYQLSRAVLSLCVDVARWYHPQDNETPEQIGQLCADLACRIVGDTSERNNTPGVPHV